MLAADVAASQDTTTNNRELEYDYGAVRRVKRNSFHLVKLGCWADGRMRVFLRLRFILPVEMHYAMGDSFPQKISQGKAK